MKILAAVSILFLLGCQSAGVKPTEPAPTTSIDDKVTAEKKAEKKAEKEEPVSNDPIGHWLGFCKPTTNEIGEVVTTKAGPNSNRGELQVTSNDELVWINNAFKEDDCSVPYNASKTYVKCENAPENKDGFRSCKVTKNESIEYIPSVVADHIKRKVCGRSGWKLEEWQDVTDSTCGDKAPFVYKLRIENGRATLKIESEAGDIITQKFKRTK